MPELLPVVAAVLTTAGAIVSGIFATRRLARYGLTTEQLQVTSTLRDLLDVERQKRELLQEERDAAKAEVISIQAEYSSKLKTTQHDLDDCARQRDNAYAELRLRGQEDVADELRSKQRNQRRTPHP